MILNESHRARNVSIKVSRTNKAITLTFPVGYNKLHAIRFLEQKRERILEIKRKQEAIRQVAPPAESYDIDELRSAAKAHLPGRIAEISAQTGLKFSKVTLRATRSKWGSCTSQNNISLSIFLMILPHHLIDFVIIHELCHTVHHNHSPKFHQLVDRLCGGREKELNRELRGYSIR